MLAEPVEPTLSEALQSLLAACLFDLRKGRDPYEVIAKLCLNINPIADAMAQTEQQAPERLQ